MGGEGPGPRGGGGRARARVRGGPGSGEGPGPGSGGGPGSPGRGGISRVYPIIPRVYPISPRVYLFTPRVYPIIFLLMPIIPYQSLLIPINIPVARCRMLGRLKPPNIRRLPGGVGCWAGLGAQHPTQRCSCMIVFSQKISRVYTQEISCVHTRDLLCAHKRSLVCTQEISCVHTRDLLCAHKKSLVCTQAICCGRFHGAKLAGIRHPTSDTASNQPGAPTSDKCRMLGPSVGCNIRQMPTSGAWRQVWVTCLGDTSSAHCSSGGRGTY